MVYAAALNPIVFAVDVFERVLSALDSRYGHRASPCSPFRKWTSLNHYKDSMTKTRQRDASMH